MIRFLGKTYQQLLCFSRCISSPWLQTPVAQKYTEMNVNTGYTNTDDTNTVHTNTDTNTVDKNTDTNTVDTNTATNTSCIFCIGRPWAAAAPGHHSFSLPRHLTLIDNGITNTIIFSTIILNIIMNMSTESLLSKV